MDARAGLDVLINREVRPSVRSKPMDNIRRTWFWPRWEAQFSAQAHDVACYVSEIRHEQKMGRVSFQMETMFFLQFLFPVCIMQIIPVYIMQWK
jgi:hypothetical protein